MTAGKLREKILKQRQAHLFPTMVPYYEHPLQLVKAKGSYVWDEEGQKYLDAIGGIICISVGHNHPKIKEKMQEMIDGDAIQHTTFLYLSEHMADFAEKLSKVSPGDLNKVYMTNSGSEANELAVMTARAATGRQMVLSLRHGYHGGTNVTQGLCGHGTWKFQGQPQASVAHVNAPYCYRCPWGKKRESCALECADEVQNVIETVTDGKIAAFICEPILGVGGFIDAPVEYHKKVFDIVKKASGLYISDEVQTGVGRTGRNFFAITDSGVVPDLITMAKGIGNGAAVGAVVTKTEHAHSLKGKLHFNTFGGDPYQAMQATKVIEIVDQEDLIQNCYKMGHYLKEGLLNLQKQFPIIGDVRGRGLLLGLELVKDQISKEPDAQSTTKLMDLAKDQNLLIGKGGLHGNVIRIAPALTISKEESDQLLKSLQKAFEQLS